MSILTLASYYDYYSSVWSVIIANATWKQPSQPQLNSFPPIIVVNIGPTPDVRCGWDHTAAWLCMNNNTPQIFSTLNHCTIHSIPCKCQQPSIWSPFPVKQRKHPSWWFQINSGVNYTIFLLLLLGVVVLGYRLMWPWQVKHFENFSIFKN